jgi:hypothetical protein
MPKIRRRNVPRALVAHLEDRVREREIPMGQLQLFSEWLDTEPEAPSGKWFKRFPGMIACGEGELNFCGSARLPRARKSSRTMELREKLARGLTGDA